MNNLYKVRINEFWKSEFKTNMVFNIVKYLLQDLAEGEQVEFLGSMKASDIKEIGSVFITGTLPRIREEKLSKTLRKISSKAWIIILNTTQLDAKGIKFVWENSLRQTFFSQLEDIKNRSKSEVLSMKRCSKTVDKLYESNKESRLEMLKYVELTMFAEAMTETNFVVITADILEYIFLANWLDTVTFKMYQYLFIKHESLSEMVKAFSTLSFEDIEFDNIEDFVYMRYMRWNVFQLNLVLEKHQIEVYDTAQELAEKILKTL